MARLLPPLACALVLLAIAWRVAAEPGREPARARIVGMIREGNLAGARNAVEDYLDAYDEIEDRWFAADVAVRTGDVEFALAWIFDGPDLPADAETPRRFARLALNHIGWVGGDTARPTTHEAAVLAALLDANDPEARARATSFMADRPLGAALPHWVAWLRDATGRPLEATRPALARRSEREARIAATLRAARPGGASLDADELDLLAEVVGDEVWREKQLIAWPLAAMAWAVAGGERAQSDLRARLADLRGRLGESPAVVRDEAIVSIALAAAGDAALRDELMRRFVLPPVRWSQVHLPATWFVEALLHGHRRGDASATEALVTAWTTLGAEASALRERVAFALWLEDGPPDDRLRGRVAWLEDLERAPATPRARVIAAAARLRSGEAGALDRLVATLRDLTRLYNAPPPATIPGSAENRALGLDAPVASALIVGLRAMLLAPPPGP